MVGHIYVQIQRNWDRSKLNQVVVVFLGLPRFLFAGGSVASFAVPSPPDSVGLGCFGGRPRPRFGAEDSAPGSSSFFSLGGRPRGRRGAAGEAEEEVGLFLLPFGRPRPRFTGGAGASAGADAPSASAGCCCSSSSSSSLS